MRRAIAILACALALGSCRKNEPPATVQRKVVTTVIPEDVRDEKKRIIVHPMPNILDKSLLGTKLAPDGTVAEESSSFKAGQPIALTIWLKQSPPGLSTSATWFDISDRQIAHEQRRMNGEKMTTFRLAQTLKPGKYRVEALWGGNIVVDKSFEVTRK
jgi:hypothetical protein